MFSFTFSSSPPMQIPDPLLKNWEITDWLCLKKTHIIFRAMHKQTNEVKIFQLISHSSFSKVVWTALSHIHSEYLLLPKNRKNLPNGYLLTYDPVTPLDKIIQTDGMDIKMILQLLLDISQALQQLHQAEILHMDVSPRNIYLSDHGHFILGDFSESIPSKSKLSRVHFGSTPGYTAPECTQGKASEASDQYSLAMLAYILFNDGLLPTDLYIFPEPAIVQSDPKIGQEIFSVLRKALSADPSLRYKNLSFFQEEIRNLLSNISATVTYCLHISDKTHPFFQSSTEQNLDLAPKKGKGNFLMVPAILSLLILLLFSRIYFADGMKEKRNLAAEKISIKTDKGNPTETSLVKTDSGFPTETALVKTDDEFPAGTEAINIEANFSGELDFAGRNLSSLTEVLAECNNPSLLQRIYGENNHLKSVEEFQLFPSLQELYLSNNQIQNTESFQELTSLSVLILSDNLCSDLRGLSALTELNFLDLSGNRDLSDISPLASCQNLNTLILSDTAVTESSIEELRSKLPECEIFY